MQNDSDEKLVKQHFLHLGWQVKKLPENNGANGQRPDFFVETKNGECFYCEVKGPHDPWLNERATEAENQGLPFFGGLRSDPVFNRIARQLQKAIKQFSTKNPGHLFANVVFIVNHDAHSGVKDLVEVCTGFACAESGPLDVGNRYIAERLRRSGFWETVDLILWIDTSVPQRGPLAFFNTESSFYQSLCDLFGYNPAKLCRQSA